VSLGPVIGVVVDLSAANLARGEGVDDAVTPTTSGDATGLAGLATAWWQNRASAKTCGCSPANCR